MSDKEPNAGNLVAKLVAAAVLLLPAAAVWAPVALTEPPGYHGQGMFAIPAALAAGRIRWTPACTLVAAAELMLLPLLVIAGLGVLTRWRGLRRRINHLAGRRARRHAATAAPDGAAPSDAPSIPLGWRHPNQSSGAIIGYTVDGDMPLVQDWQDMTLDVWGPTSEKLAARIIPAILDAPGPLIATTTIDQVVRATRQIRATQGQVWIFDPQNLIGNDAPRWWWNPLTTVTTITAARRLAHQFTTPERRHSDNHFELAATELVATLLLAAAASQQTMRTVYQWTLTPDQTPITLLRQHGHDPADDTLAALQKAPQQTRDATYATARTMLAALAEPSVTPWVTPGDGRIPFDEQRFVTSRDTLYLLSRGGPGSPAPLVSAFAEAVLLAAEQESNRMPGRRLDPPLLSILDNCAALVRIETLPNLFAHHQGRGLPILAILGSYADGQALWGDNGMRTIWDAANIVTYGGGIKDARTLETLGQLIGEHDPTTSSTQDIDPTQAPTPEPQHGQHIHNITGLATLPPGHMLVMRGGKPPALARTRRDPSEPAEGRPTC